jgi:hypothetical protein
MHECGLRSGSTNGRGASTHYARTRSPKPSDQFALSKLSRLAVSVVAWSSDRGSHRAVSQRLWSAQEPSNCRIVGQNPLQQETRHEPLSFVRWKHGNGGASGHSRRACRCSYRGCWFIEQEGCDGPGSQQTP